MAESASDSGSLPVDRRDLAELEDVKESPNRMSDVAEGAGRSVDWSAQIRRPAVWGLLVLIAIVLAVQIWLLYL